MPRFSRFKHSLGIAALLTFAPSLLASEPVQLFDGKTLDGWEARPSESKEKCWSVEDGVLVAENADKKGSDLWTVKRFRNYELELEYKTPSDYYDSGVFLRSNDHQVQIGISGSLKIDLTACIYAPKDKQGSYPARSDKVAEFNKTGKWNHLRIILTGKRIQTFLNGETFVDYESVAIGDEGPIGLQLHAGHHMKMLFRNIKLSEID